MKRMMSSLGTTSSDLLVAGYINGIAKQHTISIPSELYGVILMFYPRKYALYGIGMARYHQFGLKQECQENNSIYHEHSTQKKWHHLSKMSSICFDPNFISCGNGNFFIVNMQNEIYASGNNTLGCLGINAHDQSIARYTKINIPNAKYNQPLDIMSKGQFTNHSFIVLKNIENNQQTFYALGDNSCNQQGHVAKRNPIPTNINILNILFKYDKIIQITTGYTHSLFLSAKGKVYSCGDNEYGECGIKIDENKVNQHCAVHMIPFLYDIESVSCGDHHNLCIDKQNNVWCFGRNDCYQLGLGEEYNDNLYIETAIINPFLSDIYFIECGDNFSLCINKSGKAYMFGDNTDGQCGAGNETSSDVYEPVCVPFCIQSMQICTNVLFESGSCGCDHTQLISYYPENNLYGFGSNGYSQSGNISDVGEQSIPYKTNKADLGIVEHSKIVKVLCDENVTVVICEV